MYCPEIERPVLADVMSWVPPGFGPFESYDADHTARRGRAAEPRGARHRGDLHARPQPGHVTYAIARSSPRGGAQAEAAIGSDPSSENTHGEPERALLSGDVLFQGSVGRVDLPGGDWSTLEASIEWPPAERSRPETTVYPGHMGITTLGRERDTNPFLAELRSACQRGGAGATASGS